MSLSRFLSQNIGNINVNDQINLAGNKLTASSGNLFLNDNLINGNNLEYATIGNLKLTGNLNGQNLQLTSDSILLNGSVIGTSNTTGSVNSVIQTVENDIFGTPIPYFTNTLGNVITNTAWNYYPGNSPFGLGYTSGGLLATDDAGTIFYLGDDNVYLGSITNSTGCSIELVSSNTTQIVLSPDEGITVTGNITVNGNINMPGENTLSSNTINAQTINVSTINIPTLSTSNVNADNGTFGNINITNITSSSIFVYHTASTSDQDPMGSSSLNLVGQGGGGAVLNLDFSTYTTSDCPTARISMIDNASFASTFNIMTKQSGSPTNGMVSRILIEPVNGYVGINKTNPEYQLDVNGTAHFSGDVSLTNLLITGSLTTPIINIGQQSTNGNYIITKEMSGTTFFINKNPADNGYIYLPTPSGGLNFKFIQANPEQNWTPICVPEQNLMIGQINVTGTQGSSYANTSTPILDVDFSPSSVIGDTINIVSDGTYYYYSGNSFNIDGFNKIWQ
jgi:hypothetical protein